MLALAVNFKLVPLLLVPVWVLGSIRAGDYVRYGLRDRVVRLSTAFAVRGALIGCMAIAVFLLFFLKWGKGVFGFLSFFDRSVHVESLWGSLALLITVLSGTPADLTHGYGAFNVAGPAADFLKAVSPALMVCALAGLTAAVIARCIRAAASGPLTERDGPLLSPSLTVTAALAFLLAVFSLSKVFSPQFLLVAVPVAALAPFTTKEKVYFYAAFAAACLLSTALYPFCYFTEVVPRPLCPEGRPHEDNHLPS
jgi:hypothetical protein